MPEGLPEYGLIMVPGAGGELTYRGLRLDPFQVEAIEAVREGKSAIVSAPTGTGKTLIADYLIDQCASAGQGVIYTAPIKALSNQKYLEFKGRFGADRVGIITGDVVINRDAPIRVMTTEIFRNMLHTEPDELQPVVYVIFDEIHYLSDQERGTVWEEAIIFKPPWMRLLGLSATVPNIHDLSEWIEEIHGEEVRVIISKERAVPLTHHFYEHHLGRCTRKELIARHRELVEAGIRPKSTTHIEAVDHLRREGALPCLYLVFSRRQCETKAGELAERFNFLNQAEKDVVEDFVITRTKHLDLKGIAGFHRLVSLLLQGIGVHHAGMLPVAKEIVEELFARRLIHVLYATETWAVGLNMPLRTVVFDSCRKYDGETFRFLKHTEYFQMAGRAGRRGIDREGFVYTLADLTHTDPSEIPEWSEDKIEPIESQFALGYNTILQLVQRYDDQEILKIFSQSFGTFVVNKKRQKMRKELGRLSGRVKTYEEFVCQALDLPSCPATRQTLDQEARTLEQRLRRAKRRRYRGMASRFQRRLDTLKRELERHIPVACPEERCRNCRLVAGKYREAMGRIELLEAGLAQPKPEELLKREFKHRKGVLGKLSYLKGSSLLDRGEIARGVHIQELLVTELLLDGTIHESDPDQVNAIIACVDFEPRRDDFVRAPQPIEIGQIKKKAMALSRIEKKHLGRSTIVFNPLVSPIIYAWSKGAPFKELIEMSSLSEGDIVSVCRRTIDLLRQIKNACPGDWQLASKINLCIAKLDRDVVSLNL
ncbi:MAG: DEAD/DEAH box helicase [Firmicutes bacterium]|nr:DEAD/DEAH box helicase [Bacillota bacterium]